MRTQRAIRMRSQRMLTLPSCTQPVRQTASEQDATQLTRSNLFCDHFLLFTNSSYSYPLEMRNVQGTAKHAVGKGSYCNKSPIHKPAHNCTVGKILNLVFCTNLLDGLTSSIQNQGCGWWASPHQGSLSGGGRRSSLPLTAQLPAPVLSASLGRQPACRNGTHEATLPLL